MASCGGRRGESVRRGGSRERHGVRRPVSWPSRWQVKGSTLGGSDDAVSASLAGPTQRRGERRRTVQYWSARASTSRRKSFACWRSAASGDEAIWTAYSSCFSSIRQRECAGWRCAGEGLRGGTGSRGWEEGKGREGGEGEVEGDAGWGLQTVRCWRVSSGELERQRSLGEKFESRAALASEGAAQDGPSGSSSLEGRRDRRLREARGSCDGRGKDGKAGRERFVAIQVRAGRQGQRPATLASYRRTGEGAPPRRQAPEGYLRRCKASQE